MSDNKDILVDKAMRELNKKHGEGTIMRLGEMGGASEIPRFTSGIASLDLALGGGWPYGRMIEIYGPEASGKTSVALFALAELQKLGRDVAFIDLENALDPMLAEMYGVDTNNLLISYPMTGEAAFEVIEGLAMTGSVGAIVLDSVSAIIPTAEREEDVGKSLPAIQARLMSQVLRRLVGVCGKTGTTVFFINQIREKVGMLYGNPEITSGGRALSFYASQRVNVRIDSFLGEGMKEQKSREGAVGHKTNIQITKNKIAPPFKRAGFMLKYGEGFDKFYDVSLMSEHLGIVERAGAWYNYKDYKWQGKANMLEEMRENEELLNDLRREINEEILRQSTSAKKTLGEETQ